MGQIEQAPVLEVPVLEQPSARIVAAEYSNGMMTATIAAHGIESQVRFHPSAVAGLRNVPESSLSDLRVMRNGQAVLLKSGEGEFTMRSIAYILGIETAADSQLRASRATSAAKAAAVRENGKKGGRPRKNPVPLASHA